MKLIYQSKDIAIPANSNIHPGAAAQQENKPIVSSPEYRHDHSSAFEEEADNEWLDVTEEEGKEISSFSSLILSFKYIE